MRKNHILSALAMAAVTFGLTACADTDAQYTIPDVDAPQLVSSTPTEGANKVREVILLSTSSLTSVFSSLQTRLRRLL